MSAIGDKLRELRGTKSQTAFAAELGIRQPHLSELENSQAGMSEKAAEAYGRRLGVDAAVLMVGHGLEVAGKRAARGELDAGDLIVKTAKLLNLAHQSGAVSDGELKRLVAVGQDLVQQARKGVTTKSRPADTQSLVGRDGVGRATKSAGVRSSYANSIPTDSPSGYIGGGRPETESISHPAVRALADAVLSLEESIANGTVGGHQILEAVATVWNSFEQEAVEADKAAAGEWLKRLKKLTSDAAQGIGSTTSTKSVDSQALAGRDAMGRARTKRYGA